MTLLWIPHIAEVMGIEALEELFHQFSNITGTATDLVNLDGSVLIATKWQEICTNFHRVNPETATHYVESDTILACQLEAGQKYHVYCCKNGLIDIAVPIVIDDAHIGILSTGQFFSEKPGFYHFEQKALGFGFDREAYLEAPLRTPGFIQEDVE